MPMYFSLESPGILVYYISSLGLLRQTSTSWVAYSSRNLFSKNSGGKKFQITRCQWGRVLFRSSGGETLFASSSFFWLLTFYGIPWLLATLLQPLPPASHCLLLYAFVCLNPFTSSLIRYA